MDNDISPSIWDFISQHIVSVSELEVLLFLLEGKDREWTAGEINQRLRNEESSIAKWLEALVALGLAAQAGHRFKFAPASEDLEKKVMGVAEAYRERRIKVIELIFSKPNGNLINFVHAFELRKKS